MTIRRPRRGVVLLIVLAGGCVTPGSRPSAGPTTAGHRAAPTAVPPVGGAPVTRRLPPLSVAMPLRVAERAWETPPVAQRQPAPPPTGPAPSPPTVRPSPRDWLETAAGEVRTPVGTYRDCQGRHPLTHLMAAIDVCITDRTYFVGHNPGVFTPLLLLGVGSILVWFDHAGRAHPFRVVAVRVWRGAEFPPVVARGIVAQFQTCIDVGGSFRRILDAVAA